MGETTMRLARVTSLRVMGEKREPAMASPNGPAEVGWKLKQNQRGHGKNRNDLNLTVFLGSFKKLSRRKTVSRILQSR
jgi:hypothetical protein